MLHKKLKSDLLCERLERERKQREIEEEILKWKKLTTIAIAVFSYVIVFMITLLIMCIAKR